MKKTLVLLLSAVMLLNISAALAQEPHRIAFYLYDLAGVFHALWSRGKEEEELRFVQAADPEGTKARLALVRAAQLTLANGMRILGVTPMDEMR